MDYEEIQRYQAERETRLEKIQSGSVLDNDHIRMCLDLLETEPDDLVRIYARLWLVRNACQLAQRIIDLKK